MRRLVVKVLKNETILVVASILALISCFIVPPDKEYAGYIHASTISQLMAMSTKAKVTPIDVQTCGERSMSPKASSPTQRAVDQSVPSGQS